MLSIILPLCERQHLGWSALQSALQQDCARADYEVIIVLDGPSAREARGDAIAARLLDRCDAVVSFDGGAAAWENRLRVYLAGAVKARGDLLFFMEGHTILRPGAVRDALALFAATPALVLASAYPRKQSRGALAQLVDCHHVARSKQDAGIVPFGLGGQSAIRRDVFLELAPALEPFDLYIDPLFDDALRRRNSSRANLAEPFCLHANDFPTEHWHAFFQHLGALHLRFLDTPQSQIVLSAGKRKLLRRLRPSWVAGLLAPPAGSLGRAFIQLATALGPLVPRAASPVFSAGMRLTTIGGFCRAALLPRAAAAISAAGRPSEDVSV